MAVSYCPPAYDTDLAAGRGQDYLYEDYNEIDPQNQRQAFDRGTSDWKESDQIPHPE